MNKRLRGGLLGLAAIALSVCVGPACSSARPKAQRLPLELLKNHPKKGKEVKTTGSVNGVVLSGDGAPVDFALVAAVSVTDDPEDGKTPFLTTSRERGKFELSKLPPGNYGLTVTAPEANTARPPGKDATEGEIAVGSFAGVVTVTVGEPGPPMLIRLAKKGISFKGRVVDQSGAPLSGALVRAVRESPFEGDHFFAKTDSEGHFVVAVPAAHYFLVAQAEGRKPARLDMDTEHAPVDALLRLPPALTIPTKEELNAWISASGGIPKSVDGDETDDLAQLASIVGKARVVGLGEASFTGSEIARLKLRMFKFLVQKMKFTTLLIEAGQADVRAIDEYVLLGKGRLLDALAGLGFFSLDTEEALAVFSWMRAYNADHRNHVKLRVAGLDVQRTAQAASDLEAYFLKVDKAFLPGVETTLDRLRNNELGPDLRKRPADEQDKVMSDLVLASERLRKEKARYQSRNTGLAYQRAVEDAAALVWAAKVYRDERERGPSMADLAKRTIERLPKGSKVAIWAHDTQVSKRKADGGMGAYLADTYKADYVALAATFYQGWIRAWDFTTGPTTDRGTKLFRLPPAEPTSLEGMLDNAQLPMFFADLRKAPGPLMAWFESRLAMRSVGTVFESDRRARFRTVPKEAFDGVVFIKKLTTVKFNETGKRPSKREWE